MSLNCWPRKLAFGLIACLVPLCASAQGPEAAPSESKADASSDSSSFGSDPMEMESALPRPIEDEEMPATDLSPPPERVVGRPGASKPLWSGSLSAFYLDGFEEVDGVVLWKAALQYMGAGPWTYSLSQGLRQNLVTDPSKKAFEWDDTRLGMARALRFAGQPRLEAKLSFSASLPLSLGSQTDEIYSVPSARSLILWSWSPSRVSSFGLGASYTWSRYKTRAAYEGEGGDPLPLLSLDLSHGSSWDLSSLWSLDYGVRYVEILYQDVPYEGSGPQAIDRSPAQGYELSLGVSYTPRAWISLSGNYQQGSALQQPGFADYVLFDSATSLWSLGVSLKFP